MAARKMAKVKESLALDAEKQKEFEEKVKGMKDKNKTPAEAFASLALLQDARNIQGQDYKFRSPVRTSNLHKDLLRGEDEMTPGVVYVGHIPHGFYEHEMRGFFSQFGTVNRLRLSRSKKTGGSKGYAFVEFACDDVAKIVAETMNNYMMFGKLLKCSVVSKDKIHPRLWVGSNRKFRAKPYGPTNTDRHNKPRNIKQHTKQVSKLVAKEAKKRDKLKKLGVDYDFPGYTAEAGKHKPEHTKFDET